MHHVRNGYRSMSIIMTVNADRLASAGMVIAGLVCGALMGSALLAA
jgi:hypothetical protein